MRYYTKPDPQKSVPQTLPENKINNVTLVDRIRDAGLNYRKEEGTLSPHTFIVIVSGGERREKDYFKFISNNDRFKRIKLKFIADRGKLNPDGLLETAKFQQEHYRSSQEDEPDEIYIVSDVDHFYNDLLRIKPECQILNIHLIISNSCFEIWLYYGKFADKPHDFNLPTDPHKISKRFKTYLGNKVNGGINPRKAIFDIETAIQNARNNYQEDKEGIPVLFSTNMFILAESILPFIKEELSEFINERNQSELLNKNKSQSI